jgi:DNA-binding NarL/FixJ family response regulator
MSAVPARIAGIAIPDNALAREATEFVSDASTRCCSTIHDECSSGRRCGPNGTFIAPAGVTSSEASPRLTRVGGPDEVEATEARCEIRVLIADGEALVRAGFRVMLEGDARITVVGEAATGEEAVAEARRLGPDGVLINAMLPGLSCVEATALMLAESGAHVMLLTASESDERIFAALRAGASGLLLKDTEPTELVREADALARGEALLAPRIARRLIAELASRPQPECPSPELLDELTAREREVLALVALGLSNDEIAERLVVSRATAKTHVSRAMVKLHARDRAKLVVFAYEAGLVAPRAGSGTRQPVGLAMAAAPRLEAVATGARPRRRKTSR